MNAGADHHDDIVGEQRHQRIQIAAFECRVPLPAQCQVIGLRAAYDISLRLLLS
jgi:hypothetical protein